MDRTLFQVITTYGLQSFISSGKVHTLLESVWEGLHTTECDGSLIDFSLLTYLAGTNLIYIPGKPLSLKEILTSGYQSNLRDTKFWFQYKYRHTSVAFIFFKDLVCALGLVICFQYISFQYLELFRAKNFEGLTTAKQEAKVQDNIDTYNGYNFIGSIFAATMLYSFICKLFFNFMSDIKVPWDRWTILDTI